MFVHGVDQPAKQAEPGVTRKVLAYNGDMMMCEIAFEAGAAGQTHAHPHTQVTYVKKGCLRFTLGDEVRLIHEGDSVLIPPFAAHGAAAEEPSVLVDVFSPARWDFVTPADL